MQVCHVYTYAGPTLLYRLQEEADSIYVSENSFTPSCFWQGVVGVVVVVQHSFVAQQQVCKMLATRETLQIEQRWSFVLRCHVNPNLRVTPSEIRGSGGWAACTNKRKDVPWVTKRRRKKRQADRRKTSAADSGLDKKFSLPKIVWHLKQHILYVFVMRVHMCHVQVNKDRPSAAGQHDCASGTSCSLSTVTLEDVLASDVYSCATWGYIQSDLLEYLKWYR